MATLTAAEQLAEDLTTAGDAWASQLPAGAAVLHRDDEWMHDAVQLGDAVIYFAEHAQRVDGGTGRWYVQGWSSASAARRYRTIPLSAQRAGVLPAEPDDGDHAGWS